MLREGRTGGCWRRGESPWKLFSLNSCIRGTERVGGDEGNEKAKKKKEKLFSFLLSQNCYRNLRRNGHKLLIISM